MPRPPLSSTGSLGLVPPLPRYYERLGLLVAHPASLRFLRSAVPAFAGDGEISQVPGEPSHACPALRPRWDRCVLSSRSGLRPTFFPQRCRLPQLRRRRLPPKHIFRGSITRPACSLSTLRSRGHPRTTQDSLPAGGSPCRAGLQPAGSHREVSKMSCPRQTIVFLPTQASPGAP